MCQRLGPGVLQALLQPLTGEGLAGRTHQDHGDAQFVQGGRLQAADVGLQMPGVRKVVPIDCNWGKNGLIT